MTSPEDIVKILRQGRFRLGNEKLLQEDVGDHLSRMGIQHVRERRIGAGSQIDFLLRGGIGIECKLKCPRRQIWRQLERYLRCDDIKSIILLTATAMGLPEELNGKPIYYVSAGKGLL